MGPLLPWDLFLIGSGLAAGLIWGSFANVLAFRIPRHLSVVLPGSFCTSCGRTVRPYDNVPVLSFVWLRGRCRDCASPISWRYPMVEGACGVLAAAMVARFGPTSDAVVMAALGILLVVLFLTDWDWKTLPDELTVPGIVAGLGLAGAAELHWVERAIGPATFADAALGATAGAVILLAIMTAYQAVRDRSGMGVGDVKLLACIGAFLGLELTMASFLLAVVLGAAGGLLLVAVRGGGLQTALPFGTYLAISTVAVILFYDPEGGMAWAVFAPWQMP